MAKIRVPMQVSPEFQDRIRKIKKEIMKKRGESISDRDLSAEMVKLPDFDAIEKKLLSGDVNRLLNLDSRGR